MTIEQNTPDGKLKHVHKATGGLWGGNKVNQEFFKFISEVISTEIFESFVKENLTDFFSKRAIRNQKTFHWEIYS